MWPVIESDWSYSPWSLGLSGKGDDPRSIWFWVQIPFVYDYE